MIRVKKILVSHAMVGMKVAHNIHSELGALIVQQDTVLDHRHLKVLRSMGIPAIDIYVEDDQICLVDMDNIGYTAILEDLRNFLSLVKSGDTVDLETLAFLTEIVEGAKEIRDVKDIVFCLNQVLSPEYYIYSHSLNVALLSMLIARWMKLPDKKVTQLLYAGILHDIGKLKVDPSILNKPGKLTEEEFEEVKRHTFYGFRMVENLKFLSPEIKQAILFHHEREDGSGYPSGIKTDKIPQLAKILAVADIYDAMTSPRVYSEEKPAFKVFKMMEDQSYGRLDLVTTQTLLQNIAGYYVGHRVILSNGEKGEIVFINPLRVSRPIIKTSGGFLDLSMNPSIHIEKMAASAAHE